MKADGDVGSDEKKKKVPVPIHESSKHEKQSLPEAAAATTMPSNMTLPPRPREPTLAERYARIAAVVSLYWFVSITLVFVNKSLLSVKGSSFSAPFFVTWFQCLVTVALLYALQAIFSVWTRYV